MRERHFECLVSSGMTSLMSKKEKWDVPTVDFNVSSLLHGIHCEKLEAGLLRFGDETTLGFKSDTFGKLSVRVLVLGFSVFSILNLGKRSQSVIFPGGRLACTDCSQAGCVSKMIVVE